MSLVVLYDGQRKVVKVPSPNTLMHCVLSEACAAFGIQGDASLYALRHKRSLLDASQPFRFCNLSNNAQLDLVCISSSKNMDAADPKNSLCRIALTVEGSSVTITENFNASCTMTDLILHLVNSNKLPSDVMDRSPEIIYLRNSISGEHDLKARSLSSLGLSGQSARLKLRYDSDKVMQEQSLVLHHRSGEDSSVCEQLQEAPASEPSALTQSAPSESSALTQSAPSESSALTHSAPSESSSLTHSAPSGSSALTHSAPSGSSALTHSAPSRSSAATEQCEVSTPVAGLQPSCQHMVDATLEGCVSRILECNFDVVTAPAVLTLCKYLVNILDNPSTEKYRRINTHNKAFQDKVSRVQGAIDFLLCVRFHFIDGSLVLEQQEDEETHLRRALALLVGMMDSLEIPPEDRPTLRKPRNDVRKIEATFDPFKASILRTAPQPVRVGTNPNSSESLSRTDAQLIQLQKRRMELEGDPMGVDRSTLVVFPREEAAPVKSDFRTDEGIDTDSSAISRTILQRVIAHTRPDNDGPPLTTKAIRDLQKAQRERVYSRTLIRIKFPDRVCVQAYFHPRNSSDDVYRWLSTCLRDDSSRMVTDERYSFELYLSPPRITLPLSEEKTGGSCLTLAELQLVPAAVVHLAWKAVDGKTVDGCRGSYLQQHLVAEAQLGDDFSGNLNRPIEFPTSQQLVQSVSESLIDATLPMDAASKDDNPHHSTTNTKSTRPKWFK